MDRWLRTHGTGRRHRMLVFYLWATTLAGIAVASAITKEAFIPDPITVLLYLALGILGQHFEVTFADGNTMGLSDPVVLAALWSFGPPFAILVQCSAILTQIFTVKKAVLNTLFNCAHAVIEVWVASLWIRLLPPLSSKWAPGAEIVLVFITALTYDMLSQAFVSGAVYLDLGEETLPQVFLRITILQRKSTMIAGLLASTAGVLLVSHWGLPGLLFVAIGLFAIRHQMLAEQELASKSIEAETDALTGLWNLRHLEDWLDNRFIKLDPDEDRVSVIFIDVDKIKAINDNMGHDAGDLALITLADAARSVAGNAGKAVRYGGDEFVIICEDTVQAEAEDISKEFLNTLADTPFEIDGTSQTVRASVGVACFPKHSTVGRDLIRIADKAMYLAKRSGGNTYCTADQL